ncbi:MAG: hypothetical protein LBQ43_02745, partial [Holosporales bacterium]|nr:hypothetical protein [Holosporales bacterium]
MAAELTSAAHRHMMEHSPEAHMAARLVAHTVVAAQRLALGHIVEREVVVQTVAVVAAVAQIAAPEPELAGPL